MQDRYLFRGKRIDNGEWVIGNRIDDGVTGQVFIHTVGNSVNESDKVGEEGCLQFVAFEVAPATICQCTGVKDKNGNLIWENDIVAYWDSYSTESGLAEADCIGKVVWDDETISFQVTNRLSAESYEVLGDECSVIGNVFDNQELLEE
jgi:uncharacterized phage protein (TIGR01671 family)|nr:MAG TPA: YopX protein [Bacteriophage sp.]